MAITNGLTLEQFLELYPRASASTIKANGYDCPADPPRKTPKLESDARDEPLAAPLVQETEPRSFYVRVVTVRKRLLDEDNLCEKFLVDQCRYAGLIPDDNPQKTQIQVSQRLCEEGEPEHVIVEVYSL